MPIQKMLTGIYKAPAPPPGGGISLEQSAEHNTNSSSPFDEFPSATWSATPTSGNFLLMCMTIRDMGVGVTVTLPSGWISIIQGESNSGSAVIFAAWKQATGSEPSSYTIETSSSGFAGSSCVLSEWSGVDMTTPIDGTPATATLSSFFENDHDTALVSGLASDSVAIHFYGGRLYTAPSGAPSADSSDWTLLDYTPDGNTSTRSSHAGVFYNEETPKSDANIDHVDNLNGGYISFGIAAA